SQVSSVSSTWVSESMTPAIAILVPPVARSPGRSLLEAVEPLGVLVHHFPGGRLGDDLPIGELLQAGYEPKLIRDVVVAIVGADEQVVLADVLEEHGQVLIHLARHVNAVGLEAQLLRQLALIEVRMR